MSRSWLIVPLLLLYVFQLGGVGFLGPDEPRYAAIGRDMAVTGHAITPRLNGEPWFEKPPLTYWLTASGHLMHLPDEWAARLPVALISVAFLIFFYVVLAREFTPLLALAATCILATAAGWMAYSFAALTDLPMSAALSTAILIALFLDRQAPLAGAFLGLSILGKGFVPLVLFAPLLLIARKRFQVLLAAVIVAAPWFILCALRNGHAFWDDFFWKQHVARFLTPSLEHVQPVWYYIPVLLAGLFPWTPLALLLAKRHLYSDRRLLVLALWLFYGLAFFSIARNKLPGYLLPLLPGFAILLAAAWESARSKTMWLAVSALLLIALPTLTAILPGALLSGLSRTQIVFAPSGLLFLVPAIAVWMFARKPEHALLTVAVAAALGAAYLKYTVFPALDTTVSVRNFWRSHEDVIPTGCVDNVGRTWQYGLNYYATRELPPCAGSARTPHITTQNHRLILE
ncbi:MAG: glycosyltransferase family 39 protein [Acidobacteriota bacterium]|nr:glycosyltransferase family 39 protein [Acidobacteriota bacterium]